MLVTNGAAEVADRADEPEFARPSAGAVWSPTADGPIGGRPVACVL